MVDGGDELPLQNSSPKVQGLLSVEQVDKAAANLTTVVGDGHVKVWRASQPAHGTGCHKCMSVRVYSD
jgi:hypothetical protein